MSVKRALQLTDMENTPLKMAALEKTFSPHTGTRLMSPVPATRGNYQAKRETSGAPKAQAAPQTNLEKLRSNLENSVRSILKARRDLESQLPIEGSSELNRFFLRDPGDLLTELKNHKKLVAKVESRLAKGMVHRDRRFTGSPPAGNSHDFLKSILR